MDVVRDEWLGEVATHHSGTLVAMASAEGVPVERLHMQMIDRFATIVGACEIRIRMRDAGLARLLSVGHIATAFHTGPFPGRDSEYLEKRAAAEAMFFRTCTNDPADTGGRPAYGYLYESDEPAIHEPSADPYGLLFSYGPIVVVTVPEVVVDATFTFGDSLMRTDSATVPKLCPAPAASPHHLPHDHALGDGRRIATSRDLEVPTSLGGSRWEYIEGQIHGEVGIGDLDRIVFLRDPGEAADALDRRLARFAPLLDARGIEWDREP